MRDRTFGALALTTLTLGFAYYTVWALVVPLVDDGHPALKYFPKPELAVAIPGYLGAALVSACVFVVGAHMIAHKPESATKEAKKAR
jgi:hypothetical protein